jgi:2-polyprenyl-6-methoxyphenol hydroxylase-like FAD-dependent oxidoreductase
VPEVLIIGGGIGGLALAIALDRCKISSTICEQAEDLAEVGAGVSVWSNGIRALDRLGLAEKVIEAGTVIERLHTFTSKSRQLDSQVLSAWNTQDDFPTVCAHRADLQRVLRDASPHGRLQLGARCVGIDLQAKGASARFGDGTVLEAAMVVGADGIDSTTRASLHGRTPARWAGYCAFRGITPGGDIGLPPHEAAYYLGQGSQVGLFPCGRHGLHWYATANGQAPATLEDRRRALEAYERHWPAPVAAAIRDTANILCHDIYDRPPIWPWGEGRVTFVGDAIHPTTPNLGQGACQALEDAVVLAASLYTRGIRPEALRQYEQSRRQRTSSVVQQSWSIGKLMQLESPVMGWLRDRALASTLTRSQTRALFERLLSVELPPLPPILPRLDPRRRSP